MRATSNTYGSVNTSSSRLADWNHITTLSPALTSWPPMTQSFTAVRRKWITGVAQRTISSTAVGMTASKSSARIWRCSGWVVSAYIPWLMALRVVSLPAATSRMKNDPSSSGLSRWTSPSSPATSACISAEVRSSVGSSSRARLISWAICDSSTAAFMIESMSGAYSGSPAPRMMLVSSNTRR